MLLDVISTTSFDEFDFVTRGCTNTGLGIDFQRLSDLLSLAESLENETCNTTIRACKHVKRWISMFFATGNIWKESATLGNLRLSLENENAPGTTAMTTVAITEKWTLDFSFIAAGFKTTVSVCIRQFTTASALDMFNVEISVRTVVNTAAKTSGG